MFYVRFSILVLLCLVGCRKEQPPAPVVEDLRPELEQKTERIDDLENQLSLADALLERSINEHRETVQSLEKKFQANEQEFMRQIAELNREIADLKKELVIAKYRPRKPEPPKPPPPPPVYTQAVVATTPRFVMSDATKMEQALPVRVFDIRGQKIVTGSHQTPDSIETDEEYKDNFGRTKKVVRWEEITVQQFGYEIRFSLENQTDQDLMITARAGLKNLDIPIAPGATLTNIPIQAALGSALRIMSGGKSQSFRVTY